MAGSSIVYDRRVRKGRKNREEVDAMLKKYTVVGYMLIDATVKGNAVFGVS